MSTCRPNRMRDRAFTLVELLVVIGIIALLISILVPSLTKARNQANAVKCANNMRQMFLACQMFAQDNKGWWPRPALPNEPAATDTIWAARAVCIQLNWGVIDLNQDLGIFAYIKGLNARKQVMLCPGDNGEATQGGGSPVAGSVRNHSYSWNACMRDLVPPSTTNPKPYGIRQGSTPNAARKIMIAEELAPNDVYWLLYDGTGAGIVPPGSPRPMVPRGDDYVTGRHGGTYKTNPKRTASGTEYNKWANSGRGNYAFFDGHVAALTPNEIFMNPEMFFLKDPR